MEPSYLAVIDRKFDSVLEVVEESRRRLRAPLAEAARVLMDCFRNGGKVLTCGVGDSAAAADYLAASFVRWFRNSHRPGLPALCLEGGGTRPDRDHEIDFELARRVQLFGQRGDVLVAINADGPPEVLARTRAAARERGLRVITMQGRAGSNGGADVILQVPSDHRHSVAEGHLMLTHLLLSLLDHQLEATDRLPSSLATVRGLWELPTQAKASVARRTRLSLAKAARK
jgi:phosphoheptose isomerase